MKTTNYNWNFSVLTFGGTIPFLFQYHSKQLTTMSLPSHQQVPKHIKQEELQRNRRMQGLSVGHILELIENLECEIALLKIRIQQVISNEEIEQDILVDNIAYLGGSTDQDSILVVDAEIIKEDAKP
jgi:hypothetical protein